MPTIPLAGRTFQAGLTSLGPANVGQPFDHFLLSLDTTAHTNPAILARLSLEVSLDGGTTWRFVASSERPGGSYTDDDGNPVTTMSIESTLPLQQGGEQRRVRASLFLSSGTLVSSGGSLEVT